MKKFLSSILALTLCVGAVGFPVNVAVADDGDSTPVQPTTAVDTFKMAEGASISITGAQGIRFRVEIGDDVVETAKAADDFGFLVFPQVYLATAVANVTAGTAENYHDKFDGELVENQVPADKAGTYGLFDYAEVSLSDEDLENAVYTDFDNGLQYVNVVMTDGVAENRDVELAAIAWYKTGENYTYADFNADFSRSITYVAQQEYIAGNYSRDGLKKAFPWLTSKAFEINSGADMKELALASQTETFEGFTFKLTKTVAVGSDYVPVAASFAGTFEYGNYALLMVDNANEKPFAAESETLNVEAVSTLSNATYGGYYYKSGYKKMPKEFIDASTTQFLYGNVNSNVDKAASVSGKTTKIVSGDVEEDVAYFTIKGTTASNATAFMSCTSAWHCDYRVNETTAGMKPEYSDLLAVKELFSAVKFRIYVEQAGTNGQAWASPAAGVFNLSGYNGSSNKFVFDEWIEYTVSIDDIIAAVQTDGITAQLKNYYETALGTDYADGYIALDKVYVKGCAITFYFADAVFVA